MKIRIRRMDGNDIDAIVAIEQLVFQDPWRRESFEFEIYVNKFSYPVVLELDDRLIGYAIAWQIFEEFHIADIAIHPDYQGKGWGKFLLEHLIQKAQQAGSEYVMLEVRPSNERAIRLYQKFGFQEVGRRRRYYRNGEDALIMKKNLSTSTEFPSF